MTDPETTSTMPLHGSFLTPRGDAWVKEPSRNPYDYLPKAPPRFRELSTDSDCDTFHSRISYSTKPLSDRLFLDLDSGSSSSSSNSSSSSGSNSNKTKNDCFVPIALAPVSRTLRNKYKRRKVTPISKTNNDTKKHLAAVSKPKPPRLSVSWIQKRSLQPLLLKAR